MTLIDDNIYYEYSTGYLYELKEKFGGKYYTPLGYCSLEYSDLIRIKIKNNEV